MRAEVGLLTRNVKLRGDVETSAKNQYGANIFIHSSGDDSVIARLEYIELNEVGQAFKIGRYAVHFHMIGAVHQSYARGCSTHEGFNRAFTMHGTHHLRLTDNVVYHVMGHNFFIEDAIETKNLLQNNLVISAARSWSLLNTDQTPAGFWVTHPDNEFTGNRVGGSDRYAYWYDLQEHAIGPSANINICSEYERVGIFRNNSAHSCGRYGLRIFHNMVPRQFPCKPIVYDPTNTTDPFYANPLQTVEFRDLTSWKNNRNGAIAGTVGDIKFINFKVADNILAGVEMEITKDARGTHRAGVYNSTVVAFTSNNFDRGYLDVKRQSPHGVITPRSEFFTVSGVTFVNFNFERAAALGDCSHCFHPAATDSGARTAFTEKLTFVSTTRRIRYQYPFTGIFNDLDGSLTGKGPDSYATFAYPHLMQPGCTFDDAIYDGVICDNTAKVRRISIHNGNPSYLRSMSIKILKYDDAQLAA